jgi:hypothetical protein
MRYISTRIIRRQSKQEPKPPLSPTIELKPTIIVSTPPKEPRPWWHFAGIAIIAIAPILISGAALWISILGYRDQETTNTQRYAALVTSWITRLPDDGVVLNIQNLGNAPVSGVFLHLINNGESGKLGDKAVISTDDVPPCSIDSISLTPSDVQQLKISASPYDINNIYLTISDLRFVDADEILWDRDQIDGTLSSSTAADNSGTFWPSQSKIANGCG